MQEWRSVGQGVKTPPFHGGNTGSNPVRTILSSCLSDWFFFRHRGKIDKVNPKRDREIRFVYVLESKQR